MRCFPVLLASIGLVAAFAPSRAARAQESTTITAERASVRETPSNDGKVVVALTRGTSVTVLERRAAWSRISVRSKSGWVRSNSLAPVVVATRKSSPAAPQSGGQPRSDAARPSVAARRQPTSPGALHAGDNVFGPIAGLGGINGSLAVGAELERAVATLPSLGNGTLGISLQALYYHYEPFPGMGVTAIPFGAAANYHFGLKDQRVDPFVGLGIGYTKASVSGMGYTVTTSSGTFLWGRAGVRYFVKPGLALHAEAGLGSANLNVGVMLRP